MQDTGLPLLSGWQNYYIIIGTAAATLTGLMFVATTLISRLERHVSTLNAGISAFNTPTIVHFCAVLLVSGILSAPWQAYTSLSLVLGFSGLGGAIYLIVVLTRMRRVPGYPTPVKDWLWYLVFPLTGYVMLILSAIMLPVNPAPVLYIVSAAMVLLLFIGIHNAWDLVTYFAVEGSHPGNENVE